MKRSTFIVIVLAVTFLVAGIAQAEKLSYSPSFYQGNVAAGGTIQIPFTVTVSGLSSTAKNLKFVDSVVNLPATWIQAEPETAEVQASGSSSSSSAGTNLTIYVPQNAAAGIYYGKVLSTLTDGESVEPGFGSYIMITVEGQSCQNAPAVTLAVSPKELNVRNASPVDVTISGTVSNPEGCSDLSLNYSVDDSYGSGDTSGELSIDSQGAFTKTIQVVASRAGQDKQGRIYTITLNAENEAGTSASTVNVTVVHDNRR